MSFSILPRKLLDLFISTLLEDPENKTPIATLKACSLVCKSLGVSARARLFSTITINYDLTTESTAKADGVRALKETLERDKGLARGVHSLQIHIWSTRQSVRASQWQALTQNLPGVLHALRLSGVGSILGAIRSIREEPSQLHSIAICVFGGGSMEWDDFHGHFHSALKELCMARRISTFRLESISSFDISFILQCMPRLKRLDTTRCEFRAFPKALPRLWSGEALCPQLDELYTKETTLQGQMSQSEAPERLFGSLKVLEIQPRLQRFDSHQWLSVIRNSCSKSLRMLRIIRTDTSADADILSLFLERYDDFSIFTSLQTIIFEMPCMRLFQCIDHLKWVSTLLSRTTSSPLQMIQFNIISHITRNSDSFFINLYRSGYLKPNGELIHALDTVDRILFGDAFESLCTVKIRFLLSVRKFEFLSPIDDLASVPPHTTIVDLTPLLKRTTQKLGN